MDEAKAYYKIVTDIWKAFKRHLQTVETITDSQDAQWGTIVEDFERIEKETPPELRRYTGDMIMLHIDELERKWRTWNKRRPQM